MPDAGNAPGLIKWQAPMRKVLVALVPLVLAATYCFGWRVLFLLALANASGFAVEHLFCRLWKEPVSSAVFVSCTLFTLSLPPALPAWMTVAGAVFGILFGKMAFGGFGRNIFNPALTGRAFLYVSFGAHMTSRWSEPFSAFPAGLLRYAPDGITHATPGMLLKAGETIPFSDLFFGQTSGVMGGTSALLTLVGGLYLLFTKAANYRIVVAGLAGFLAAQSLAWVAGVDRAANPVDAMMAGGFLFGMFFFATDPVSASQTQEGRWIYGALVGALSSVISVFSVWPAGTMFAILLANMFAPILDLGITTWRQRRKGVA